MSKYQTPYRYDFVGSFLRPQEVKQAKADYSEGKITKEECDAIVDKAERIGIPHHYRRRVQKNLLASGLYVGIRRRWS